MFEDKNNIESDLMMRSILENGQEEVPAHVWEGVSAGLDKMARKKVIALWWRRAAIGGVAAAAAVLGIVLHKNINTDTVVPESFIMAEETISVMENEVAEPEQFMTAEARYVASPAVTVRDESSAVNQMSVSSQPVQTEAQTEVQSETPSETQPEDYQPEEATARGNAGTSERFPDIWPEEEEPGKRIGTSLVFSGITGTNSSQNSSRQNMMKLPTLSSTPLKTGITETSTNSTYGIPVSFGAGVKFDFNSKWSLGIGANYTMLSRKFYGKYTYVNSEGIVEKSTSSDIKNTQHYIGIPVNAYYNIVNSRNVNLYAYAGGALEKCISDKYDVLNTSIIHKEKVDGMQISTNIGIGVEFMLGKHLGLYADPSLRYYFNNNQPKSIRTAQPLMFGLEMGLRVRL